MAMPRAEQIYRKLLDLAASCATQAKAEGVESTQINKLAEVFESRANIPNVAVDILIAYILRQAARREREKPLIGRRTAEKLVKALIELKNIAQQNNVDVVPIVREFLILLRWLYEAIKVVHRVTTTDKFDDLIRQIVRLS